MPYASLAHVCPTAVAPSFCTGSLLLGSPTEAFSPVQWLVSSLCANNMLAKMPGPIRQAAYSRKLAYSGLLDVDNYEQFAPFGAHHVHAHVLSFSRTGMNSQDLAARSGPLHRGTTRAKRSQFLDRSQTTSHHFSVTSVCRISVQNNSNEIGHSSDS